MITPFRKIRNCCCRVKWWFMWANGKLPPCDWWDFKYNLADYIRQGLFNLLYNGNTDWDSPHHKQERKELEEILDWANSFPYVESGIIARDSDDLKTLQKKFGDDVLIITESDWEKLQKEQERVFKLLAKNFSMLWD